jgi:hypothetical protein
VLSVVLPLDLPEMASPAQLPTLAVVLAAVDVSVEAPVEERATAPASTLAGKAISIKLTPSVATALFIRASIYQFLLCRSYHIDQFVSSDC